MARRITMRHILCPIDYSECSRHALDRAIGLAARFQSRVTVLHVIGTDPPGTGAIVPAALTDDLARAWEDQESMRLDSFVEGHLGAGVSLETKAVLGERGACWREIQAEAEALPADLIVMGTHGRTGLRHLRLGSVAEKLLRVAPCPVLTVRADSEPHDGEPLFLRIVCATDLTAFSDRTVDLALSLAAESQAHVTLVHVVEELGAEGPEVNSPIAGIGVLRRARIRQARQRLRELALPLRTSCDVHERVETGRAWKQVLRVAREAHADLVVVGARTGGAFGRLFLGSNAKQVVRLAPCPVLVARNVEPFRGGRVALTGARARPRRGTLPAARAAR